MHRYGSFFVQKGDATLLKMIFDAEKYKGKYVMHCKTESEAKSFCRYLDSVGRKWCYGKSYLTETNWKIYKDQSCYKFNTGQYADISYYLRHGYLTLEWSNYVAADICSPKTRELEIKIENIEKMVDCKFPVDEKYVVELIFDFLGQLEKIYEIIDKETVQKEYAMTFSTINVIFIEFFESSQEILSEDMIKEYFEKIESYENKNMYLPYTFSKFVRCNYEKFYSDG